MGTVTINLRDKFEFLMEMPETYNNEHEILNHSKSGVFYEPDISSTFLSVICKGIQLSM